MSHSKDQPASENQANADATQRAADFLKQVKSEEVPSGLRPDLAPPGDDGEGGDGGGVGNSI